MVFGCLGRAREQPVQMTTQVKMNPETGEKTEVKIIKRLPPRNPPWKVRMVQIMEDGKSIGEIKALAFKKKKGKSISTTLASFIRDPSLYEEEAVVKVPLLLFFLPQIKQYTHTNPDLQMLIDYLEWEEDEENSKIESMVSQGLITFDSIWYLFKKDFKFVTTLMEEQVGSLVESSHYELSMFGGSFKVQGSHITTNGRMLSTIHETYAIGYFYGYKAIQSLNVRPMSESEFEELNKRGQLFKKIAIGPHYLQYTGNMFFNTGWVTEKFKATGRVVIDPHNFSRFNPDYRGKFFQHASNTDIVPEMVEIPERKVFSCVPIICGFSLTVKRWGQMHIKDLSPINYDVQAFDYLVMDPSRKALVRSLVENSGKGFTDIISGKGGGCVFLLHGPPGTGKTLTAEAISDLLKRPLYSVTVGELGVTTKDLEARLRQILELAWEWDAVLLIDESDIFLERRKDNDIKRNALVGIFLRLLEYHQGVLFLTSNRVKAFDDAFHSRISVALHYEALDQDRRRQVFDNLLTAAKIKGIDTHKMSQYNLNGRQIKSTIRLAQSLALSEGVPVNISHMEKTVGIALEFQRDLLSDEIANEPCNS